ncbi:carboxypeptidase-like regulatory domain-containing protein [Mucilaginibacter sp. HD30]
MRRLLFFVMLLLWGGLAMAQQTYNITGIVTDDKDAPIPGATIFIADSRKVTGSDKDGRFVFSQVQPGNYNLVVKMIGYQILQHAFMLQNKDARFRFKLAEDNVMLNTVNITSMSLAERKRLLAIFTECFLGRSKNAAQCKILNTDDIKIRSDKRRNIITASSSDFLIIENKALGYTMKYLLNGFTYDRSGRQSLISFDGTLFFEDMKGNPRQQKKWEDERVNTYLGSVPHFFRSMFSNTLDENGFVVYQMLNRDAIDAYGQKRQKIPAQYSFPIKSFDKYVKTVDDNFKTFNLGLLSKDSTELYIVYTPKKEPADFLAAGSAVQRFFRMPDGQASTIYPSQDSLLISRSGDISPVKSVILGGFFAWGQVAAFLPSDYAIPNGMEPPKIKQK